MPVSHIVQMPQRHHGFLQRSITGPLAQAIDGGADVGCAGIDSGQRVGGRKSEIVVGVHFDFNVHGVA